MNRPRYVRRRDVENEIRVLKRFSNLIPAKTREIIQMGGDYDGKIIIDGKLSCICEVKGRTGTGDRFETWHIARSKLDRCVTHAAFMRVPLFLIFTWDTDDFFWNVKDHEKLPVREGGRWDRGDRHDVEPMTDIPRVLFKKIPA